MLPTSTRFKTLLQQSLTVKNLKMMIKQLIESTPSEDSNLQWLFGFELSDIGESPEYSFHD